MRSMKSAEKKFREWLDAQPIGTKWTGADVMQMMKGNKCTELLNIGAVRSLMGRFKNVEYSRNGINAPSIYEKVSD